MSFISRIKDCTMNYCSAVILAAGLSTRMGEDKMFSDLCGIPVLARTVSAFEKSPDIAEIVIVTRSDLLSSVARLNDSYSFSKVKRIVIGGETRTQSALAGVSETSKRTDIICIHDGARPFVSQDIIHDAIRKAVQYQAAIPAVPVKDTIKLAENDVFTESVDRNRSFAVQTPQTFQADIIKAALTKAVQQGINYTDDSSAVEAIGVYSRCSLGSEFNIKITTPFDLILSNAILQLLGE